MNEIATIAATKFCEMHTPISPGAIENDPEKFLKHTVPYLTVRTLHRHEEALARHEKALASLEVDSRSIRRLTWVLVFLTIVLAYYAAHDTVIHLLQ